MNLVLDRHVTEFAGRGLCRVRPVPPECAAYRFLFVTNVEK